MHGNRQFLFDISCFVLNKGMFLFCKYRKASRLFVLVYARLFIEEEFLPVMYIFGGQTELCRKQRAKIKQEQ